MSWRVLFHTEFDLEFQGLEEDLQDELLAHAKLLQQFGPQLGRPSVDTLTGSKHANVKELTVRVEERGLASGVCLRPEKASYPPGSGDKGGADQKRF